MRALSHLILAISALLIIGVAMVGGSHGDLSHQTRTAVGLQRSDAVIEAKIARKKSKLDGTFKQPKNPHGLGEFRRRIRVHPEGTDITQLKLDAKDEIRKMRPVKMDKDAGLWDWDWLGPGNIGGRIRAILLHPTNENIMWIGSAGGGIWKTTNAGASWFPLDDFLPSLSVTALVMDPTDPDIIYASTGEGYTWMPPSAGIFKSYDGGTTWQQLANSLDSVNHRWINDMIIDPTDGNILLAGTKTEDGDGWVIRSHDAGENWYPVWIMGSMITDLAMDPDDPNIVLASSYRSVYRSDQKGAPMSWTELSTGMFNALPDTTGRTSFAFGVGNDMVYASMDRPYPDTDTGGEIWRSSDNGVTWEWRSSPGHLRTIGWYTNVIWLEPGSTDNLITGGLDLLLSTNGGLNFHTISDWKEYHTGLSAHADQHVIIQHINYNNGSSTIFFGNDGGIQKSNNGLFTLPYSGWVNLANNLGITQFYNADASPDGSIILGGTQDNDDLRFTRSEGAQAWYQSYTGDGTYTAIHPLPPHHIMYTAYIHLEMAISLNGGDNYSDRTDGLWDAGQSDKALFIAPFALDKIWPTNLVAGGRSIWRTNNSGDYWHEVLEPRTGWPLCSAVEISPTEGSVVTWVGYEDGSIWKTENIAVDWTEVPAPVAGTGTDRFITDIEISPHDPNTVLVSYSGYLGNRVWLTRDNGQNWQPLPGTGDGELPHIHTNCVTFHPSNSDWIYVGTDIGIFASEDMGQHWSTTQRHDLSEGPTYVEVSDLFWHSETTLVAATYGRGIYECRPLEIVFVNAANSGAEDGTSSMPYNTLGEGYNFIGNGSDLVISGGDYNEGPRVMDKRIQVTGDEGVVILR